VVFILNFRLSSSEVIVILEVYIRPSYLFVLFRSAGLASQSWGFKLSHDVLFLSGGFRFAYGLVVFLSSRLRRSSVPPRALVHTCGGPATRSLIGPGGLMPCRVRVWRRVLFASTASALLNVVRPVRARVV
jgi:hypothetical protein